MEKDIDYIFQLAPFLPDDTGRFYKIFFEHRVHFFNPVIHDIPFRIVKQSMFHVGKRHIIKKSLVLLK